MAKVYNLFLSLCLVVIIPTLHANILENDTYREELLNEFDEYWKEREAIAEKDNKEAYFPDPYAVTENFTSSVSE